MLTLILLGALIASFCFYVYSVYRCRLRTRVMAKAFTSLIFVAIAAASFVASRADTRYFVFIIIALALCTCGDVFLEISKTDELGINYFIYSLGFFFAAHVAFTALFCTITGVYPVDFFMTAAILTVIALISRRLKLDFLNMESYILGYAVVISFMLVKSFSLIYGVQSYSTRNIFVAVGAGLFFIASLLYAVSIFGKKIPRSLASVITGIYYAGQVFIAFSVLFAR